MCGLSGFFARRNWSSDELKNVAMRMTQAIAHRGPDDSGIWVDPSAGVALGFRRLAIVDLSALGHQPMPSPSGRFTLVFNGEIFNHRALRKELEASGWSFRGHSDTEVILAAFECWGIERSVRLMIGMFAMAVWDSARNELSLVRDRLGIKPMFIYQHDGIVSFGSELKALVEGPAFDRSLDVAALTAYLRYLYVPAPRTIFQHASKLLPGTILTICDPTVPLPSPVPFWSAEETARSGAANQFRGSDEEAVADLEGLLTDAVRLRMQADVPLGALLSGGIDSSTVVALMQASASRPVKTFTIGFDEKQFNEASHARAVARHLGTDHTELLLSGEDALAVIPRLAEMYDEPLADPSQIPTFLVCQLARKDVTVTLTGDGGDELFGGYNRYIGGEQLIAGLQGWPRTVRRISASGVASLSSRTWDKMGGVLRPVFPAVARTRLIGEKMHKIGDLLRADSTSEMYRSLLSAWQEPESLVEGASAGLASDDTLHSNGSLGLMERMMLADQASYLPDDLLAKLDRASMAVSLEARVPILDHRVVEMSWRLPRRLKVRDGKGKWILRQILYKHVPQSLVDREKMGFSVPLAQWLAGPLRNWAGDLLLS
ncbi:MAG TPA: asparagine synthase (glutamine-hydrolyzing), partial [Gemmatimonadaceae bacterium]|nr:asparagine synthase (glutamine-hydrolyzing) [Gemmatimonadaceae bacterium]